VVALEDGEELRARVVLSNADPKRTFLGLVAESDLPASFVARIRAYKTDGASIKMNLAVDELPRSATTPRSRRQRCRTTTAGSSRSRKPLEELDDDQHEASAGRPAENPHIELCIPTVHDPSLAPAGKHVVTIGIRSQPYTLAGGDWDSTKDAVPTG
jgi:phytoene dehydrogenase-like protein